MIKVAEIGGLKSYALTPEALVDIVKASQQRNFSEEVDKLEAMGGITQIARQLEVNPAAGIGQAQVKDREAFFGSNKKPVVEMRGFCLLVWDALQDMLLRVLIVAAVVSIILEVVFNSPQKRKTAWIEGFSIIVAVMAISLVTAFNNYQKELQFRKLNEVADSRKMITVRRDSKILNLHMETLLVGDVVTLTEGMEIPADCLVLQASELQCDQSAMTGESQQIKKSDFETCKNKRDYLISRSEHTKKNSIPSCVLYSGTKIVLGNCKGLVIAVGRNSCLGKITAILSQKEQTLTPLQEKLQILATDIGKFGLASAIVVFLVLMIRFAVEKVREGKFDNNKDPLQIVNHFIISVTVVVVAIPEGLPLSVTISLAYSMKKMLSDNNLVRKMEACETMGGADQVCSDKTGTLTTNRMTLTNIWNETMIETTYDMEMPTFSANFRRLFCQAAATCSTAILHPVKKGSSTEIALLEYLQRIKTSYESVRQETKVVKEFPFSSARKRMGVIVVDGRSQTLLQKGASQIILRCCNKFYRGSNDEVVAMTPELLQRAQREIKEMAGKGLRTLCIAMRNEVERLDKSTSDNLGVFDIEKSDLTLLCVIGVRDVPRPQVIQAIKSCKRAGVRIRMVTGDNKITAKAIAQEIGIAGQDSLVLQGPDFIQKIGGVVCKNCNVDICDCPTDADSASKLGKPIRVDTIRNKQEFKEIAARLDVLARSRPQDKYALVTGLMEMGHVVAVTGDGTNDAPALKKADVGFAMGITGTQVAREAAAIVLLDDNFNSIVKAISWGRNIYDSIKKFIQFQLTVNVVAVMITLVGSAVIKQELLSAIQMLWVNLIMDTFASLALATEPPVPELLERNPHKRDDYIISKTMFKHIIASALLQLTLLFIFAFAGETFLPQYPTKYDDLYFTAMSAAYVLPPQWKGRFYLNSSASGTVCPGRMIQPSGVPEYRPKYDTVGVYSRHFTMMFNLFVFLQFFNFMNSRKLKDELNIFNGIGNNPLFWVILFVILGMQIIIICFFGSGFQLYNDYGLTIEQWLICVGFGALGLIWTLIVKLLPIDTETEERNLTLPPEEDISNHRIVY